MRRILIFLIGVALICSFLSPVAVAKMTLKFGHVAPPFHGQSKGIDAFAEYVLEKTNGEIEIKTFPLNI